MIRIGLELELNPLGLSTDSCRIPPFCYLPPLAAMLSKVFHDQIEIPSPVFRSIYVLVIFEVILYCYQQSFLWCVSGALPVNRRYTVPEAPADVVVRHPQNMAEPSQPSSTRSSAILLCLHLSRITALRILSRIVMPSIVRRQYI